LTQEEAMRDDPFDKMFHGPKLKRILRELGVDLKEFITSYNDDMSKPKKARVFTFEEKAAMNTYMNDPSEENKAKAMGVLSIKTQVTLHRLCIQHTRKV
jgi:hypothetical protein